MKKTILSIFVLGMVAVFAPSAEAATATTISSTDTAQFWEGQPRRQARDRRDDRRNNRRDDRWDRRNDRNRGRWDNNRNNNYNRVRYETVTVRRGNKLYRETYRITWDNGRVKRKRVDRVRIR